MGYLICGPVGTGKTYLAECFAGSVGIPCVKLRNFRSKYVGETEGNLEQILNVLRAMGPVVVVIDEADAALGNREAGGDSGTSSRVFSMIAGADGRHALPRQAALDAPDEPARLAADRPEAAGPSRGSPAALSARATMPRSACMIKVMARKNKTEPAPRPCPGASPAVGSSGADIESIVLAAKRTRSDPGS